MAKGNANVDYKKLWKLLIDKDMKKTDLITVAGISSNVLAKLNKGEYVSMESIQKICKALDCDVGDICVMNDIYIEEK
ncbi:helix-turn-helix domain-containing protein [Treponema berlinense]|uniref:helix-turn-helix domain-containing protein n=1 Tax=Treponema berlinense TaxID=225004 RepID=UPI003F08D21F